MDKNIHQIISEYYKKEKGKYPNLDKEQFRLVCLSFFEFIVSKMETNDLPQIRIKHFGVLTVYRRRLTDIVRAAEKSYTYGGKTREQVDSIIARVKEISKRFDNEPKKEPKTTTEKQAPS